MSAQLFIQMITKCFNGPIELFLDCGPDGRPNGQWVKLPSPGKKKNCLLIFLLLKPV